MRALLNDLRACCFRANAPRVGANSTHEGVILAVFVRMGCDVPVSTTCMHLVMGGPTVHLVSGGRPNVPAHTAP